MNLDGVASAVRSATASAASASPRSPYIGDEAVRSPVDSRGDQVRDPRRNLKKVHTSLTTEGRNPRSIDSTADPQPSSNASNVLLDFFSALAQEAHNKHRLEQGQSRLEDVRKQDDEIQKAYSGEKDIYSAIHEQRKARIQKHEHELRQLKSSISAAQQQQETAMQRMPVNMQKLFQGILPIAQQPEIISVSKSDHEALLRKVEELEQRQSSHDEEYKKSQNTRQAEQKLHAQLLSLKLDFQSKFDKLELQLREKLDQHQAIIDAQKASYNELAFTMSKSKSVNQTLDQEPPPKTKEKLDSINRTLKEYKKNFANLSNHFLPKTDYESLKAEFKQLKNAKDWSSQEKQDSMAGLADIRDQIAELQATLTKIQQDEKPKEGVVESDITATSSLNDLKVRVDRLYDTRTHYEKFYRDTDNGLKEHKIKLEAYRSELNDLTLLHNELQEKQHATATKLAEIDTASSEARMKLRIFQENGPISNHTFQSELTKRFGEMEGKYNAFNDSVQRSVQDSVKSHAAVSINHVLAGLQKTTQNVMDRTNNLETKYSQIDHSIQSLSTRYNSISTQSLYRSIANAMNPLGPKFAASEVASTKLVERVNRIELDQFGLRSDVNDLKSVNNGNDIRIPAEVTNDLPLLRKKIDDLAAASVRSEEPAAPSSELKDMQEQIITLENSMTKTSEDLTSVRQISENSRHICEEVQQNTDEAHGTRMEELEKLRTSISKISKAIQDYNAVRSTHEEAFAKLSKTLTDAQVLDGQVPALSQSLDDIRRRLISLEHRPQDSDTPTRLIAAGANGRRSMQEIEEGFSGPVQSRPEDRTTDPATTTVPIPTSETQFSMRYIVIRNLASTIDGVKINRNLNDIRAQQGLPHYKLYAVWIQGQKRADKTTDRHAIIKVMANVAAELIKNFSGQVWGGRAIEIREATWQEIQSFDADAKVDISENHSGRRGTGSSVMNLVTRRLVDNATPGKQSANRSVDDAVKDPETIVVDQTPVPRRWKTTVVPDEPDEDADADVNDDANPLEGWNAHSQPSCRSPNKAKSTPIPSSSRTNTPSSMGAPSTKGKKRANDELSRGNSMSRREGKRTRQNS